MLPLAAPLHHGEAGDPVLLEWIRHRLDEVIGLDAALIVVLLGALIVAIPVAIALLYAAQRRGSSAR